MNVHKKGVLICPLPGCDRSYSHPSSMRKHMKTHGAAAKGLPLPERILDHCWNNSYVPQFPNEPFRRRKKYNIKSHDNSSDSDDQIPMPNMTSSPNNMPSPPYMNINRSSGSDSGHETGSPNHTMDPNEIQDYQTHVQMSFMNPAVHDPNQYSIPAECGISPPFFTPDFAAYNQFANNWPPLAAFLTLLARSRTDRCSGHKKKVDICVPITLLGFL